MESSFGEKLIVTIKGGSHQPSVGVSIVGLPIDFEPDMEALQAFLDRRAPGRSELTSSRAEPDVPILVSTNPLEFEIINTNVRPEDYDKFKDIPRPGHADYTARLRYGDGFDMSGGGPFSGRMTAPLCIAGGLALQVLNERGIYVEGKLQSAGTSGTQNPEAFIAAAKASCDSIGGIVQCTVKGIPGGIGDAMYGGLESRLSKIIFGIPAVKGLEFGAGFRAASMKGSENNDAFYFENKKVKTRTNNCGGILGGITTGMPITLRVAFKPTPSIGVPQESVNLATGEEAILTIDGRHDPCVALRAVPAVEAAVALGLLDAILVTEAPQNPLTSEDSLSEDALLELRSEIDDIDNQLLSLFERRMNISQQIGSIKSGNGLPVKDVQREEEILARLSAQLSCNSSMKAFDSAANELEPYVKSFFTNLFSLSRTRQDALHSTDREALHSTDQEAFSAGLDTFVAPRGTYGLVGHPLPHSFSKEVHEAFGEYSFDLFDLTFEEMQAFISSNKFNGLSVTRPYKQDVIKFCDKLTDRAQQIGAVNTLYWETCKTSPAIQENAECKKNLVGHNTDYDGFLYTAKLSNIDFAGKNALILGTGGTSKTVSKVLKDEGAKTIYFASRFRSDTSESRHKPADAYIKSGEEAFVYSYETIGEISNKIDIIINTTPVGTYPGNLEKLISLGDFPCCSAVIDVVYNPMRTALIMEAESLGLKTAGGLPMIVAQGAYAAERFLGAPSSFTKKIPEVLSQLTKCKGNIILIGMPGCGKTTIGKIISRNLGKKFVDLDDIICENIELTIPETFQKKGEDFFRQQEAAVAKKYGAEHGQVIATGGGIILTPGNYEALHQNGTIVWLTRPICQLATDGRPLSERPNSIQYLANQRLEIYKKWADFTVDSSALLELLDS